MHKKLLFLLILFITVPFYLKAQLFGSKYYPGTYYDLNGNKVTGLISWSPPSRSLFALDDNAISYKKDKDDKKTKISTFDLKAFVIAADSFVVSNNTILDDAPVLKVILDKPTKLYVSIRTNATSMPMGVAGMAGTAVSLFAYNSSNSRYYYGQDPDKITQIDRKNFIAIMSNLMADKPDIVKQIKDKEYRIGDMYDLIEDYKQ